MGATASEADSVRDWKRWLFPVLGCCLPFLLYHSEVLLRTVRVGLTDPEWSHALAVPWVSLGFCWHARRRLAALPPQPSWWGAPLLAAGLALYALALYPIRNAMLEGYAAVFDLFALILALRGPRFARALLFPVAYLLFAVKISDKIWNLVAWKLELLAARLAGVFLTVLGVDTTRHGALITVWRGLEPAARLNIAEACSGLRMLVALMALGAAVAYARPGRPWKRVLIFLSTIPAAVFVNAVRVTLSGLKAAAGLYAGPGLSHEAAGLLMVLPALALLWLVGWMLDRVFPDRPAPALPAPPEARAGSPEHAVETAETNGSGIGPRPPSAAMPRPPGTHPGARGARIAAAVLLWGAAVGLGGMLHALHMVFMHSAVPLRRPLSTLPATLGPYRLIKTFPPLDREAAGALRARAYITRLYRDGRRPAGAPGAEVRVHVAYFTGTPDTVIHVPEICYTAAGVSAPHYSQAELVLPRSKGPPGRRLPGKVPVRVFHFLPPDGGPAQTVLYFFIANGRFLGMPEEVRALVFDLRFRAAYWCKVEIWPVNAQDGTAAQRTAARFLAYLLPPLLDCLPDTAALRRGPAAGD